MGATLSRPKPGTQYVQGGVLVPLPSGASRIGAYLRRLRITAGLSQKRLAERSGLDLSHINHIENGRANPSRASLLAIGNALELSRPERDRLLLAGGKLPVSRELLTDEAELLDLAEVLTAGVLPKPAAANIRSMLRLILEQARRELAVGTGGPA